MKEIRQIIARYESTDFEKEKIAIASVVNVEESSYRRIGARMLVSSSGQWVGGISGGCLEGDALRRSQKALYNKTASRVVYDTMDDDTNQIGVGLGCNGRIEVLFNPVDPEDPENIVEKLKKVVAKNVPIVWVQIIEVESSQNKLSKSFAATQGSEINDFFEIEKEFIQDKVDAIFKKKVSKIENVNTKDGEELKVLFEFIRPETKLVIVGDNYDVSALVGIVEELGWEITIVGRKKKLAKSTFFKANQVLEYESFHELVIDEYTAVLLMSHDYNWDLKILKQVIAQSPSYLGLLGPKKRMHKMEKEAGLSLLSTLDFFHSPMGLDIGAETPEEIAISILSEIIAVFRHREGGALKHRHGTIYLRG